MLLSPRLDCHPMKLLPRLGRYLDLHLLGQGGMGAVYRGRDPDLDRPVAIKIVLDTSPDFVERFRREARAVARLSHPNVVQVYDFGEDDSGHPYFVMELVTGRPLDALIAERGRFSPVETASVLAQSAAGLQAAHEAGIVHLDIKPSNLIRDDEGRIKVVDFGIARLNNTPLMTLPSSLLGTPTYMSPEQVAGQPVDGRSDLYSLGISCFHLLAGRPPFDSREPIALALMHLNEALPSLAERAPGTPPPLAALIVRMCQKSPDRRPASAREVAEEAETIAATLGAPPRSAVSVAHAVFAAGATSTPPPSPADRRDRLGVEERGQAATTEPSPPLFEDAPPSRRIPMAAIGLVSALAAASIVLGVIALTAARVHRPSDSAPSASPIVRPAGTPGSDALPVGDAPSKSPSAAARPRSGPVRVAVLKFRNLGADKDLEFLTEGIGETAITALANASIAIDLIERNQIADETGEIDFGETKYVDKSTAAALGRIAGAEIAIQGGFQRAGKTVRISARFVRVDTGEILDTLSITQAATAPDQLFAIQDAVAAELKARLIPAAARLRSVGKPALR